MDELNHTLKKRQVGTDKKTGEKKPVEKTIGHYKNTQDCVERLVRLICLDESEGMVISLREYAELAEKAFKKVEKWRNNHMWIPCEERYPDTSNYILLSFENFTVPLVGRYEEDENGGSFYIGDEKESCV